MSVLVTLAVILGLWARWRVLGSVQGTLNADEAYTGLQAMAILDGDLPVVIRGAAYTGTLDAYVLAPLHALFGAHPTMLKAYTSLLWAVAAIVMWASARSLGLGSAPAVMCAWAVWLAPGPLLVLSTRAYVSYGSGLLLVALSMLLVIGSLNRESPDIARSAGIGAVAGLAFFAHPMFVTVLAPMLLVVALRYRRAWTRWWLPAVTGAVVVNLPFLVWNARNGWPSLDQPVAASDSWIERLARFLTGLIPRSLGLMGEGGSWVVSRALSLLILAFVALVALTGVFSAVRSRRPATLAVVVPVLLCWPAMASLSNLSFVADSRYAVIYLPFLVMTLAVGADRLASRLPGTARVAGSVAVPVLMFAVTVVPWLRSQAPATDDPNGLADSVVVMLDEASITRLSGHYWAVLPVEYISDGEIRTAVSGDPFVVRLPESQQIAEASDPGRLAHIHPAGVDVTALLPLPVDRYRVAEVGTLRLYIPSDG
ncbi:MAG: hypothetical protein ACO3N4_00065 [Ilumatobacteraceae bacterium]